MITAIKVVVACLTAEPVVRTVAYDGVVARTRVDVFDGDQAIFSIAGVLALGGVEPDDVVFTGELSGIGAVTTIHGVVAFSAIEQVVLIAAVEAIVSMVALEGVMTLAAVEAIVSCFTIEPVGSIVSSDEVVARTSIDVFDGDETVFPIAGVLALGCIEPDDVVFPGKLSGIGAISTIDGVVALTAIEHVVLIAAKQAIVTVFAFDVVISVTAIELVALSVADQCVVTCTIGSQEKWLMMIKLSQLLAVTSWLRFVDWNLLTEMRSELSLSSPSSCCPGQAQTRRRARKLVFLFRAVGMGSEDGCTKGRNGSPIAESSTRNIYR